MTVPVGRTAMCGLLEARVGPLTISDVRRGCGLSSKASPWDTALRYLVPPILQLPAGLGRGTLRILGSDAPKALALVVGGWRQCPVSRKRASVRIESFKVQHVACDAMVRMKYVAR